MLKIGDCSESKILDIVHLDFVFTISEIKFGEWSSVIAPFPRRWPAMWREQDSKMRAARRMSALGCEQGLNYWTSIITEKREKLNGNLLDVLGWWSGIVAIGKIIFYSSYPVVCSFLLKGVWRLLLFKLSLLLIHWTVRLYSAR